MSCEVIMPSQFIVFLTSTAISLLMTMFNICNHENWKLSYLIIKHLFCLNDMCWGWVGAPMPQAGCFLSALGQYICAKDLLSLAQREKWWKLWITIIATLSLSSLRPSSSSPPTHVWNWVPAFTMYRMPCIYCII